MKNNNSSQLNILAVLLVVSFLLVSWLLISPSYTANNRKLRLLEVEITNAQSKLDSLDKTRNDLSSIESIYNSISVAVPNGTDEPNLITELESIAVKNNIALPGISISKASYAESSQNGQQSYPQAGAPITIAINVSGGFDQLNSFISDLEKSIKFFNIKDMNYAYGEDGTLNLSLNIYAYSRSGVETSDGNLE